MKLSIELTFLGIKIIAKEIIFLKFYSQKIQRFVTG